MARETEMYILHIEDGFSAAHRLREYEGDCEQLHGHNWKVRVDVSAEELDSLGMVMDFREVKGKLGEVLGKLDHKYLNDVAPFDKVNPSTEHIARFIYEELGRSIGGRVRVGAVTTWESERCSATYCGEGRCEG